MSQVEARVVLARLDYPEATWKDIGTMLSLSADACAHAHCRGVLALRVYVFTHRPDLIGGMQIIEAAFRRAEADTDESMTPTSGGDASGTSTSGT